MLLLVSVLVLVSRWEPGVTPQPSDDRGGKLATAAGIIGVGEPWTALGMIVAGKTQWPVKEENDAK